MKEKKIALFFTILTFCIASAAPAYASTAKFAYAFYGFAGERMPNGEQGQPVKKGYPKADNEQAYYLTLNKKNGTHKNNVSANNIFGCRMHRLDEKKTVDSYHTFTNYVQKHRIPYTAKASKNTKMYLCCQKDSGSKSQEMLYVSGKYTP